VISITDGQIYLQPGLFASGVRPAVDVGISVSRVGGNAQIRAMRKYAGSLRLDLSQYRSLEAFAQLGTELDPVTQAQLDRGMRLVELLKQGQYEPMSVAEQVCMIFAGTQGYLDKLPVSRVHEFEKEFLSHIRSTCSDLLTEISSSGKLENEDKLVSVLKDYIEKFAAKTGSAK